MLELLVLIGLIMVGVLALKIFLGILGLAFHILLIPIKLVLGLLVFLLLLPFLILLLPFFLLFGIGFAVLGAVLTGLCGFFCPI